MNDIQKIKLRKIEKLSAKLNNMAAPQLQKEIETLAKRVDTLETELIHALEDANWAHEQLHALNEHLASENKNVGITQAATLHLIS